MSRLSRYSPEVRERAVRLVREQGTEHPSEWAAIESICTVVPIAPSTHFWHKARHADPTRRSARVQRDDEWRREIQRVWDDTQ